MVDTSGLLDALHGIADRMDSDMSEKDVENAFLNENYYTILGYKGAGYDLRSEWTLPDDRRPDYVTLDSNESVTAVYEFKSTGRDLSQHENQLFHYVDELKSDYGILTNGDEIRVYKREGHTRIAGFSLEKATESDVVDLGSALQKPEWDVTNPQSVNEYLSTLEEVELDTELGRGHFFDTFRLEQGSPFANLITSLQDLLIELRDEKEAKFVKGAYDFWEASYASEPEEVPDSWEPFIDETHSLRDFMFCLESGHALLARLLLAKATEDHQFFRNTAYSGMDDYFRELQGFSDNISLDAYPVAANGLIEDMEEHLVQSLFEDDIFIWWTDGYEEQMSRGHASKTNQFEKVAKGTGEVTKISPATRDRFSRSISHIIFSVLKFDFSEIEGDLLGDLYQHYFDPETRKALGEFYTPQPVIDYIMDGVDYNVGVSSERLIDPACGSGTFLVEAINRYLEDVERYNDDPDWEKHLTELCTSPHIVGLDIHPFAVLMAQIRFMVAILPKYRDAKESNRDFTIRRLPIYRTDTLRNERELTGIDLGDEGKTQMTLDAITDDNQDVKIPVPLPVEVDEDEVDESEDGFLVKRIRMPLYDTAKVNANIKQFDEYFAALQGVLDVVKWYMDEEEWDYSGGLEQGIHRYTSQEYDDIDEFFAPYVDDILDTVRYLRVEHGDGRLFKIFEDTVLALVVKNYMSYDYVVGNPPYVRIQNLPDQQKNMLDNLYDSATGNYDIYCPFYERGLNWLKEETGKLGYITSNQFMYTDYGEGIRSVLSEESDIIEILDFKAAEVFDDAANLPAILLMGKNSGNKENFRAVRARPGAGREFDEDVLKKARNENIGYSDETIDVFEFPQSELGSGYWSIMPESELSVFRKMESNSTGSVSDVTDAVFQGIRTSKNTVFVVEVLDADRIESNDSGFNVTIRPTGGTQEYSIEADFLRPFLKGVEINRWRADWSGLHVLYPYQLSGSGDELEAQLVEPKHIKNNLPKTWNYLKEHEGTLRARENGAWEDSEHWYEYGRSQNLARFEIAKIIQGHICKQSTFMLDEVGTWYFTSAYGVLTKKEFRDSTNLLAAQLNSKLLDFYIKHIASVKLGWSYEYRAQYVNKAPCYLGDLQKHKKIENTALEIVRHRDTVTKTDRFPEAYLGEFDGELGYIDYEWQTRRYPVNADIQELADGRFAVTAGRSDEITDPLIDSGDREEQKVRAEYVHAAVDGRNMKSGEEQTIPIPQSREGVEQLVGALNEDKRKVEETDIADLEADIDEAVYDLFDLSEDEREVVEDYLDVF